ncbi:MAG: magnesium protoporphyrin IX methyltransferase [Sphingomonadaceae bacterium]|nr:magnesium protoporphyrin IX methyltransferase [Sphingomonadaceae bacterium]
MPAGALSHELRADPTRGGGSYGATRERLETYFDSTAHQAWLDLTSDAPVSGVRATVRAGRESMRAALLGWLGQDLRGMRLLDAGCGTGALAIEAARRGADVTAIDISCGLVSAARNRTPIDLTIDWRTGDFLDPALGRFDAVVAMDSLIHYRAPDIADAAAALLFRSSRVLFTVAPRTPLLSAMHLAGKLFPRRDRSPAIQPVAPSHLTRLLEDRGVPAPVAEHRVATTFYISHALMVRA